MADYVTPDEVADIAHEFNPSSDIAESLVTRASRMFDNLTGVADDFYAKAPDPPVYTTRTFYGNGTGYLAIDPYTSLNPVDPIVVDAANAYTLPDYVERDGMLVVYSTYIGRNRGWNDGVKVAVSANWGFPEVPAPVTQACAYLAVHFYRSTDPAFATISNAEGQVQALPIPRAARLIIDTYKAKYMPGFAFA